MWSLRPSVTWHEATISYCLSNTRREKKKKINATWQHYIKSLCVLIFLFCLCTFVWGVQSCSPRPRGSRAGENNVGIQGGNCTCCLSSAAFAVTPEEAASSQTISCVNIIHQCRQVREKSPTQPLNSFFWDEDFKVSSVMDAKPFKTQD